MDAGRRALVLRGTVALGGLAITGGSLLPYPTTTPGTASTGELVSDIVAILGLLITLIAVSRVRGYANLDTRPAALAAMLALLLLLWYGLGEAVGGPWVGLAISSVGSGLGILGLFDRGLPSGDS